MNTFDPPPEALLIERLRTAHSPKLSITRAAKLAGISEGRWRQIAKGYQQAGKDVRVRVVAPAETLARMAESVGATAEQLKDAGREDAAIELAHIESREKSGFGGLRDAMRRSEIMAKNEADRTVEEAEFVAAFDAAHPRRLDPSVFPAGEYRHPELIFNDWQAARNRMLNLTLEYAATRKIPFNVAEEELPHVLRMAADVQSGSGRPWTPPWNPGSEFRDGDEPWKAEWWASSEEVDAGHLGPEFAGHTISQVSISTDWDPERVRAFHAAQGDEWSPAEGSPFSSALDIAHVDDVGQAFQRYVNPPAPDPAAGGGALPRQSEYDLAARDAGPSEGRRRREEQDSAAEWPHEEGED